MDCLFTGLSIIIRAHSLTVHIHTTRYQYLFSNKAAPLVVLAAPQKLDTLVNPFVLFIFQRCPHLRYSTIEKSLKHFHILVCISLLGNPQTFIQHSLKLLFILMAFSNLNIENVSNKMCISYTHIFF